MEEQTRKRRKGLVIAGLSVVLACIAVPAAYNAVQFMLDEEYHRTHFEEGTYIQGMDCSDLTVEEAKERIEEKEVELSFTNGNTISVSWQEIGRYVNGTNELESFLEVQRSEGTKTFTLSESSILVNETQTHKLLMGLEELKTENMQEGKDAYLKLGEDGFVEIVPEVIGNMIRMDEAWEFVTKDLMRGSEQISLSSITDKGVKRFSNDPELTSKMETINTALKTEIKFTLRDGNEECLNYSVMKDWLKRDKDGEYYLDIDGELPNFLKRLNRTVRSLCTSMEFTTEEGERITVPVFGDNRDAIDEEVELVKIKEELTLGGSYEREPVYSRINIFDRQNTYVEVDKEDQKVRVYENGKLTKVDDCVTGNVSAGKDTPAGVYYIWYKVTNHNFGHGHISNYWMPLVSGGERGLHDAPWRHGKLGKTIYKRNGSDGCVNLRDGEDELAAYIFYNIGLDVPVIIH